MCVRSLAQCVSCVFWIIYIICTLYAARRREPRAIAPAVQSRHFVASRCCHNICKWHCIALPMHCSLCLLWLCFCIYCISHLTTKILTLDMFTRWTWQWQQAGGGGRKGCRTWCELVFFLCPNTIRESVEKTCTHPVRRVTLTRRKKQFICKTCESLSHPPPSHAPPSQRQPLPEKKKQRKKNAKFVCSKRLNLQLPFVLPLLLLLLLLLPVLFNVVMIHN